MNSLSDLRDKKIALVGFGVEGQSAAVFLLSAGASVSVFDSKSEQSMPMDEIKKLKSQGVDFRLGSLGPFDGFDMILRSPGVSPHLPELQAASGAGIPIASATSIFFDLCPCRIVGVTGTKGKGTTSSLLHQMLLAAGRDAYLCGNIGTPALDILPSLDEESIVVYELSSFQLLDLKKSPSLAIVLMITSEHLDFHLNIEEYVEAKSNIVKFQTEKDLAVINIDYPSSAAMKDVTAASVFEVSLKNKVSRGVYLRDEDIVFVQEGRERNILSSKDVPLPGRHNLENVAAAVGAACALGVEDEDIVSATRGFKGLPHRLELVAEIGGVAYYDDSISTTPESTIAAIKSFNSPKILILGGSGKNSDWKSLSAHISQDASIKAIIGMGREWPRLKQSIIAEIGGENASFEMLENLADIQEVVRQAASLAVSGDAVILSPACASFDDFRNYKDRGEQFSRAVSDLS